jgi:exodeoxyribonuclease VII small subunit
MARNKAADPAPAATPAPFDFEQSMAELEAVVARLEQGEVPLEEALAAFERGVALTRACQQALTQAEQKVEVLTSRGDGAATLAPFDEPADDDER